jgi:acyl-CoA synthetase (AMP-forming)/AMP-acid ligase II
VLSTVTTLTAIQAKGVIVDASYDADHPIRAAAAELSVPVWEVCSEGPVVTLKKLEGHVAPEDGSRAAYAAVEPEEDDVALFLHTSGTTSTPKGVPLRHSNITQSVANIVNTYELSPADSSYIVMPLFHVHGLIGASQDVWFLVSV